MNAGDVPRFIERDAICDRFEHARQTGGEFSLEDALDLVAPDNREALLKELLPIELRYQQESVTLGEYQRRFPQYELLVRVAFEQRRSRSETLDLGYTWSGDDRKYSVLSHSTDASVDGLNGLGLEAFATTDGTVTFGDYELLEEVGRGGMGVVFRARQKSLDREVAVKMILTGVLADDDAVRRFYAEAQAVASLRHPGIVTVYEVGEFQGYHFFSMDYIQGYSLAEVARLRPLGEREAAEYVVAITEAIHTAHLAGIVHRDLKPANILTNETAQPLITDFGLAKSTTDDSGMTASGKILGTPSYMPPEQIEQGEDGVGPRSDVYALGAILYELLTGRPPFRADSPVETLLQVLNEDPVSPRLLTPRLDQDLETITMRCLEKDPAQRFPTAAALAEEIHRYLAGEPIVSRPITWMESASRWCRRNPVMAAMMSLLLLLVLTLSVGGPIMAWKQKAIRQRAESRERVAQHLRKQSDVARSEALKSEQSERRQRELADQAVKDMRKQVYLSDMRLAGEYWREGNTTTVRALLEKHRDYVQQETSQLVEWQYLARQTRISWFPRSTEIGTLHQVAVSPDGASLVNAAKYGFEIRSLETGEITWRKHTGHRASAVAFRPDGKTMAIANPRSNLVEIWDLTSQEQVDEFADLVSHLDSYRLDLAFSPDGRYLAFPAKDLTVHVVEMKTKSVVVKLAGHPEGARSLSFSPNGKWLVTGSYADPVGQNVKVWDWRSGREVASLGPVSRSTQVIFGRSGDWIAASSNTEGADRIVRVWHWNEKGETEPYQVLFGAPQRIVTLAGSPDGKYLAAAGAGKQVFVWEVATGKRVRTYRGHEDIVMDLEFHPDQDRLVSAARDATIGIWPLGASQGSLELEQLEGGAHDSAFSPDGRRFATEISGGRIGFWDLESRRLLGKFEGHQRGVTGLAFGPTGKRLLSGSADHTGKIWDLTGTNQMITLGGHQDIVYAVAFRPDGEQVATGSMDGTVRLWRTADGKQQQVLKTDGKGIWAIAYNHDGTKIAAGGYSHHVDIWDVRSGVLLNRYQSSQGNIFDSLAFGIGDKVVVAGDFNGRLIGWDLQSGRERFNIRGHGRRVTGLDFSPDGTRLASSSWDGSVKLWETNRWQTVTTLEEHAGRATSITFSRDGQWLSSTGNRRVIVRKINSSK